MYKVEWNKEHTWKITKYYKNNKLKKFMFEGIWYHAVYDHSCIDYDEYGNRYIACDGCDNCELEKECRADNPIHNACSEFHRSAIHLCSCLPPGKIPKLSKLDRRYMSKEEIKSWREWMEEE